MGHRMVAHYPWVPLGWRMGMSIAVMSYDKGMYFALSGDARAPDDVTAIAGHLADAFADLRRRAGVPASLEAQAAEVPAYLATGATRSDASAAYEREAAGSASRP
jgi:hypothetical protein